MNDEVDIDGKRFVYPFIGQHQSSKDLVVLFTQERTGYVLRPNEKLNKHSKLLNYSDHWNMSCFEHIRTIKVDTSS